MKQFEPSFAAIEELKMLQSLPAKLNAMESSINDVMTQHRKLDMQVREDLISNTYNVETKLSAVTDSINAHKADLIMKLNALELEKRTSYD